MASFGPNCGVEDNLAVGARAQTLSRLFNLREGFTAEDDRLPKRVMKAFKSGPWPASKSATKSSPGPGGATMN